MKKFFVLFFLLVFCYGGRIFPFTDQQEINIGRRVAWEVERRYGLWHDPRWEYKIQSIGAVLTRYTKRKLPYTYKIINRMDANAFAIPGGFIYVTRGLLSYFQNDNEVAAVLAHETSHIELDHFAKEYARVNTLNWFGFAVDILTRGAARPYLNGVALAYNFVLEPHYSREQETQADLHGIDLMIEAGYDPNGMIQLFQEMKARGGDRGSVIPWMRSHPRFDDRIAAIKKEIARFRIVPGALGHDRVIEGEVLPGETKSGSQNSQHVSAPP